MCMWALSCDLKMGLALAVSHCLAARSGIEGASWKTSIPIAQLQGEHGSNIFSI